MAGPGQSPKAMTPKSIAHTTLEYRNGATSVTSACRNASVVSKSAAPMHNAAIASKPASPASSGVQPYPAVARAHSVTTPDEYAVIDRVDSVTTSRRVTMSRTASSTATPSGSSAAHRRPSGPGASMISTPANPAATAHRRRQPTCSPSAQGATAVRISGPAKVRAMASASGR